MVAIVCVFADDELVDQHYEFHAFDSEDALELVIGLIVVVALQIL